MFPEGAHSYLQVQTHRKVSLKRQKVQIDSKNIQKDRHLPRETPFMAHEGKSLSIIFPRSRHHRIPTETLLRQTIRLGIQVFLPRLIVMPKLSPATPDLSRKQTPVKPPSRTPQSLLRLFRIKCQTLTGQGDCVSTTHSN